MTNPPADPQEKIELTTQEIKAIIGFLQEPYAPILIGKLEKMLDQMENKKIYQTSLTIVFETEKQIIYKNGEWPKLASEVVLCISTYFGKDIEKFNIDYFQVQSTEKGIQ